MLSIGPNELLIIAVIAIFVVGPKRLPEILKGIAKLYVTFTRAIEEFKSELKEEIDVDDEIGNIKETVEKIADHTDPRKAIQKKWENLIEDEEKEKKDQERPQ